MKITDGYLIDKNCSYRHHSLKGKFANKILESDMVIPHWCSLENYTKDDI